LSRSPRLKMLEALELWHLLIFKLFLVNLFGKWNLWLQGKFTIMQMSHKHLLIPFLHKRKLSSSLSTFKKVFMNHAIRFFWCNWTHKSFLPLFRI
jgi:hypothetical protein